MKINHNPDHTTYSIVFFTPPSKQKQKTRQSILFCKLFGGFFSKSFSLISIYAVTCTLSYLQKIIYYALFHADASLQRGSLVRRRQSTSGSVAIPCPGGQWRTRKYTIVHDVLFVVSYIKLIFFTCV